MLAVFDMSILCYTKSYAYEGHPERIAEVMKIKKIDGDLSVTVKISSI